MDRVVCRVCGVFAVAVVVLASWLAGASGALASGWSVQRMAKPGQVGMWEVTRVSCASPRDCVALGRAGAPVEHWDGAKWSIDRRPRVLEGVSCVSDRGCVAVGGDAGLASGIRWSIPASIAGYRLSSLSCASPIFCTAIGSTLKSNLNRVIEHWNGKRWAIQRPAVVRFNDEFDAVSCPSATACIVVGSYDTRYCPPPRGDSGHCPSDTLRLTERWNGIRWSLERTSSRPPFMGLADMSCATPSACVAVAEAVSYPADVAVGQVERWNGKQWSIQRTPNAGVSGPPGVSGPLYIDLSGVSCASPTACTVVGGYNGGTAGPVAERWDGKRWTIQSFPGLASPRSGLLNDVSCPTPTDCTAVGFGILTSASGSAVPLVAARWTGRS